MCPSFPTSSWSSLQQLWFYFPVFPKIAQPVLLAEIPVGWRIPYNFIIMLLFLMWPMLHSQNFSISPKVRWCAYDINHTYELRIKLLLMRLHSWVGRASHQYCWVHGFKSCWSLRYFFLGFLCNCLLKLLHHCEDYLHCYSPKKICQK